MSRYKYLVLSVLFLALFHCKESVNKDIDHSAFLVLKGATLFDGEGNTIENSIIVIKDNKIHEVGISEDIIPENSEIKDVSGKFITPGMVDAHIHFFQTGFFDARPNTLNLSDSLPYEKVYEYQISHPERYYEAYIRSGVTAVYDVGDFNATLEFAKDSTNLDYRPHIANAGPLLTPVPADFIKGFNVASDTVMIHLGTAEIGVEHVKRNTARGATGIKIWSLNTQDSTFIKSLAAVDKAATEAGNHLIVHATSLEQAKAALQFNTKLLVHSIEDTIVDQEFIDLAKKNNTYYNPTLIVSRGYYNTFNAILGDDFKIEDPNSVVDSKTLAYLNGASEFAKFIDDLEAMKSRLIRTEQRLNLSDSIMAVNLRKVYDAGIPVVVGTDAGNPGTLHGVSIFDELEAMQKAGLSADDLIVMATKNGAEAMQMGSTIGTIQKGKIADLIILDRDPSEDISNMRSLTEVMRNGKLMDVKKKW